MKPLELGPALEDIALDPLAAAQLQRRRQDMQELMRVAAVSALDNGGVHLDPEQLRIAKRRAAAEPLNRPLGTGEPI